MDWVVKVNKAYFCLKHAKSMEMLDYKQTEKLTMENRQVQLIMTTFDIYLDMLL